MWITDIADVVRRTVPEARPARRVAPDAVIRVLGLFDPSIRSIVPQLGRISRADNNRMRQALGLEPRDTRDSIAETARWLAERKAA